LSAHDPANFVQEVEKEQVWDTWVYHIVDAACMRAWLKHPYFHMIK
jgi:hypothetical protein